MKQQFKKLSQILLWAVQTGKKTISGSRTGEEEGEDEMENYPKGKKIKKNGDGIGLDGNLLDIMKKEEHCGIKLMVEKRVEGEE